MVLETSQLTAEPELQPVSRRRGGIFMYYRQPNGWIAAGETHENKRGRYLRRGWKELTKYGVFIWNEWSNARPLDHLFLRGGAKELPYEQVIEEGWAYREYVVRPCDFLIDTRPCCKETQPVLVQFPILATRPVPPLEKCPYCERRGTEAQMENHIEVAHAKDLAPLKMAEIIGKEFRGAYTERQVSTMPYICGKCGDGFSGHMALARHVKEHKNDAV